MPKAAARSLLLLAACLPLMSCYAWGHEWRFFTREHKEVFNLQDTLGVPRLADRLNQRSRQRIANVEVWTAVDWNASLRRQGGALGAVPQDSYRIVPGARLSVQVLDEPRLSDEYYVRPDGTFSFPWLEEIRAEGRTVRELEQDIAQGLLQYMKEPQVTVNLEQGPQRFSLGDSAKPDFGDILVFSPASTLGGGTGGISGKTLPFSGRETLFNVLTAAGGLGGTANWRNVAVFRQKPDPELPGEKRTLVIVSDMSNFFKRADFEQNIPLEINDIVFIPSQPEYVGNAFKNDWNLLLGYTGGVLGYDDFVRRLDARSHIMPRVAPNAAGSGE